MPFREDAGELRIKDVLVNALLTSCSFVQMLQWNGFLSALIEYTFDYDEDSPLLVQFLSAIGTTVFTTFAAFLIVKVNTCQCVFQPA